MEQEHGLPSPPLEAHIKMHTAKKNSSSTKSTKPAHRTSKRASTSTGHPHLHSSISPDPTHPLADGRHKRVWKACERCRMKKTKCDGEFPCKRCKDDGLVCTAGVRKKTEFKQLPRGYAEVLENTQFALVATVQKLYSMVRNGQQWDLGEPDLNDRGQPVIHNIAQKLGCIRPNSDIDLPVHSVFPEDEQGLADLASQLEAQQRSEETAGAAAHSHQQNDRASSSDIDHSDLEDYRKAAFSGGRAGPASSTMTLSPASLTYESFEAYSAPASESLPRSASPTKLISPMFASWMRPQPTACAMSSFDSPQFVQPTGGFSMDMFAPGMLGPDYGTVKPHVLSCPNPDAMVGVGDPILSGGGYDMTWE